MPQPHSVIPGTRHTDYKATPLMRMTFDLDPTAVKIDDAMDRGQPQTGSFLLRRKERQEYFVQVLFRDTFSRILKRNFDHIAPATADIDMTTAGGDRQLPAGRHRVECVRREVPTHLPHLVLIDLRHEGAAGQRGHDGNLL